MDSNQVARAALEQLISERREDYAVLSRVVGRNAAYIQQYIKRGVPKRLGDRECELLANHFGVSIARVRGIATNELEKDDLVTVPRFDVSASAGAGSFADQENAMSFLGFHESWLRQVTGSDPSALSVIRVKGDSMFPTLSDGDDIMVDRSFATSGLRDGVYVLRRDDTLSVKRIAVHPGTRRITISSDNGAYPAWSDCDPADFDIIGRVVWAGRRFS